MRLPHIVDELKDCVRWFKVGLELDGSAGPQIIAELKKRGVRVFLDKKFHDIPHTISGAVGRATELGVDMLTLHCVGTSKMIEEAARTAANTATALKTERPLLVGVTVLTSIDQDLLNSELLVSGNIGDYVAHLARLGERAGLDGVVASAHELSLLRQSLPPNFLIVTPGVRPAWADSGDHKRVMTPRDAINLGATYVVVGRPILTPPHSIGSRREAARRIIEEMSW